MKINTKKYAEALFESVQDKNSRQAEEIIRKFVEVLIRDNRLSQVDKIINKFINIWDKENGLVEAEIVSASKLDAHTLEILNEYLLKKTSKQKIESKKTVDENILGGIIMRYEDKILDGSLRKRLGDLKSSIVK